MNSSRQIAVHPSVHPLAFEEELHQAIQNGKIPGKFHYDSPSKSAAWLELHLRYSPAVQDDKVLRLYEFAAQKTARLMAGKKLRFISFCPGSGGKESLFLRAMASANLRGIMAIEVSLPLLLGTLELFSREAPGCAATGLLADFRFLKRADFVAKSLGEEQCFFTLFGILHNFAPEIIFPHLETILTPGDTVVLGVNGFSPNRPDHLQEIVKQYDNELTHAWLSRFLVELGIAPEAGVLQTILRSPGNPAAAPAEISVQFRFTRHVYVSVFGLLFHFSPGTVWELFSTFRYNMASLAHALKASRFEILDLWISESEDEIIFSVQKL